MFENLAWLREEPMKSQLEEAEKKITKGTSTFP